MPTTNNDIEQPPSPPSNDADRVRCKIYFNRLLTVANSLEAYPVFKLKLHGVQHFFAAPQSASSQTTTQDSAVGDISPSRKVPKHLRQNIFDKIMYCVNPRAKRATERARLRAVLSASLLTQSHNEKPANIRALFSNTPQGAAGRAFTRALHRKMYGESFLGFLKRREKLWVTQGDQLIHIIEQHGGAVTEDPKFNASEKSRRKSYSQTHGPEFTYTLLPDGILHFSRADTPILDLASKHAMHASCLEQVVYAGTFRIEQRDGGGKVMVMDNDSGTYAPTTERGELGRLEGLMKWNFPGLKCEVRKFVPVGIEGDDGKNEESEAKVENGGTGYEESKDQETLAKAQRNTDQAVNAEGNTDQAPKKPDRHESLHALTDSSRSPDSNQSPEPSTKVTEQNTIHHDEPIILQPIIREHTNRSIIEIVHPVIYPDPETAIAATEARARIAADTFGRPQSIVVDRVGNV